METSPAGFESRSGSLDWEVISVWHLCDDQILIDQARINRDRDGSPHHARSWGAQSVANYTGQESFPRAEAQPAVPTLGQCKHFQSLACRFKRLAAEIVADSSAIVAFRAHRSTERSATTEDRQAFVNRRSRRGSDSRPSPGPFNAARCNFRVWAIRSWKFGCVPAIWLVGTCSVRWWLLVHCFAGVPSGGTCWDWLDTPQNCFHRVNFHPVWGLGGFTKEISFLAIEPAKHDTFGDDLHLS